MNFFQRATKMAISEQLDRRSCLKGMTLSAGAVLLQPLVNWSWAQNAGQAPQNAGPQGPPKRFIFFLESNGLYPHHVQPTNVQVPNGGANGLIDRPLANLDLPAAIAPLAPFKNRMAIIQKLSHKVSGGGDHGKGYGALGCYNWRRGPVGQTIDHALASAQPSIFPVVGLGVHPSPGAAFINTVSASAPRRPTAIVCQPELAFQSLFGSVADGAAGAAFQARNMLLDWIRSDIQGVHGQLPAAMDREQLDIYLNTFEQMRARQDQIAAISDRVRANMPAINNFDTRVTTQRFEAQCAIAASAITAGLTNVVTIDAAGGIGNYHTWRELGITIDGHAIGHMNGPDNLSVPIRRFHAERIADLARRLDAVREGNGTVLDNTLIIWMSDSGEAHHGFCNEWPIVLLGNLGGRLRTAGRFLQYPNYRAPGHRTIRNFYLALLQAVGDHRENFGEPDHALQGINQSGPLTEILA